MADVLDTGGLPVPNHLRNAAHPGMKAHGIGIGYRFPHDYEGHDVAQQYLPDRLAERRYYVPSDQGSEARIGELMAAREERRAEGPPKRRKPTGPSVDPMRVVGRVPRVRDDARRGLAETQRSDAGGPSAGDEAANDEAHLA